MADRRHWDLELEPGDGSSAVAFDSVLDPAFPEWTRAHIEVVLPDPFTPLGWTLVGPAFERTQRRMASRRLWVMRSRPTRRWSHVGRIGGYAYINVSTARLLVRRSPGVTLDAADQQMGLAGLVPLSTRTWRDRIWFPAAVVGSVRAPALLAWDLRGQRRTTTRLVADRGSLPALSTADLVRWIERARRDLARVLLAHYVVRLFTTPAVERLQQLCGDGALATGLLAGLDDLASSAPVLALHLLASSAGVGGSVDGVDLAPFTERFGHRGRSELDPGRDVWADQTDLLADRIRAIAAAGADDPVERGRRLRAEADATLSRRSRREQRRIGLTAAMARWLSVTGERTKDDLARSIDALRAGARILADRSAVSRDDLPWYAWDELRAAAAGQPVAVDVAARRRALDEAAAPPPYYRRTDEPGAELSVPPGAGVAGIVLHGVGASPGQVAGRAVVVADPLGPIPEGEILVAHSTDVAWTHLFLTHDAVVTDTGDLLSHTSIVARDLGLPAVVGTGTATAAITTGQEARVDGTAGTVTVIPSP